MRPGAGTRIAVTGVGGAPGFDLAVSLLRRGFGVIGLDADPLAPGLLIPGIIPRVTAAAGSTGYPAQLLGLCRELRPAALFSVVEHELPGLIRLRHDLAGRDGQASVILRWRLLVKGGLSVVSATFRDEQTAGLVRQVLAAAGAAGPCCVQGIIGDDGPGPRVRFIEANARFAGAFRLSEEAGADLVGQALNGMFGAPVDHAALAYQPGVYLTKYTETLAAGPRPAQDGSLGDSRQAAGEGAPGWLT